MTLDSFEVIFYTAVFVLPGFVMNSIISFTNPPKKHNDGVLLLKCIQYSLISCAIWSWLYMMILRSNISPIKRWSFLIAVSLIGSSIIGFVIAVAKQNQLVDRILWKMKVRTIHTTPTAWDYVFSKQESGFVIITLIDDKQVFGWYSSQSFSSSDYEERDIYLEQGYKCNNGIWEPDHENAGLYISKDQIKVIEFKKGE